MQTLTLVLPVHSYADTPDFPTVTFVVCTGRAIQRMREGPHVPCRTAYEKMGMR
jgi:hypothetical protein